MKKIGLLSDTHSYLHPETHRIFKECDEIWHAGDFGSSDIADQLSKISKLRGVFGNIDGSDIRQSFPAINRFYCENVDVLITHIGGYPGKYAPAIAEIMKSKPPKLFICGHSHILKVIYDKKYDCLHLNPGAAGKSGFHKVLSMLRFTINGSKIQDLEIIEFPKNEKNPKVDRSSQNQPEK